MKLNRTFGLHVACLLATTSGAAMAQTAIPTPKTASTVDANGVDLSSGSLQISDPGISIGTQGEGGLAHTRTWLGSAWTHGFMLTINTEANKATVSMGAKSVVFSLTNGSYVPDAQNGTSLTSTASAYTFTMSDGTVVTFDRALVANAASYYGTAVGLGTQIVMPNGEKVTLTYKRASYTSGTTRWAVRLQSVQSNLGYQLKYEYANNALSATSVADWSRIVTVKAINNALIYCDPSADTCSSNAYVTYQKTASGSNSLETVISNSGIRHFFTTDSGGRMITVQNDPSASSAISYTYDSGGRIATASRATGDYYQYQWTETTSTLTGELFESPTYMKVISDKTKSSVTSVTDAIGNVTGYEYDDYGRLTRVTAPEGNSTQYFYDTRGNVRQTQLWAKPGQPIDGNLLGVGTRALYPDTCDNTLTCNKPSWVEDELGRVTNYYYNPTGQVSSIVYPAPTVNSPRPRVDYTYTGLQANYKNNSGAVVASGQPISMLVNSRVCRLTASCVGAPDEIVSSLTYEPNHIRVASRSVQNGQSSANIQTETMTYDDLGNLLTVDGPLLGDVDKVRYRYDFDRRLIGMVNADPDGAGGVQRTATRTEYNAANRPVKIEVGLVSDLTEAAWNSFSPVFRRNMSYNSKGLLERDAQVAPTGTTQYQITQYAYDNLNRLYCTAVRMNAPSTSTVLPDCLIQMTEGSYGPDRIVRTTYYGTTQRISVVTDGMGTLGSSSSSFLYSANGNILSVRDGNNNLTSYEYDGLDRLKKTRYPMAAQPNTSSTTDYEQLTYDEKGNVKTLRRRDNSNVQMTYDLLDRVTQISGTTVPTRNFTYDLQGRVTQITQPANGFTHTFSYDWMGRLIGESQPYGSVSYQYDVASRRTRLTWGDGFYVSYDYDNTGNVTAIRENGATSGAGVLASFGYDQLGRRTSVTRGNGAITSYAYNIQYLQSLTENFAGTANDVTRSFTYAPSGQIASMTKSNDAYNWPGYTTLDRTYSKNGLNQYTASGSTGLGYDARGNLTSSGSDTYGYNGLNQMVTGPGGATLTYDALDRLVQTTGGSTTRFLYDGAAMIAEYNASGALVRRYVPGPGTDEPIVWYEGSGTSSRRWLHADERGSVIAVSDASGAVTNINTYDEFGIPAGSNVGRFQYTGQALIPEVGLYYFKARMYSPHLGRFMQTDPIGYADGLNMYAYGNNDPVNNRDPMGTDFGDIVVIGNGGGFDFPGLAWDFYFDKGRPFGGVGGTSWLDAVGGAGNSNEIVVKAAKAQKAQATPENVLDGVIYVTGQRQKEDCSFEDCFILTADEHTKNARPSTKGKHEQGNSRRKADRGGEKGDEKRRPPRKRPKGWKAPWPPLRILPPLLIPNEMLMDPCLYNQASPSCQGPVA